MPGSYTDYPGIPSYGYGVFARQRYPAITQDAFDAVAAAPVRAVGPRPISVVANSLSLDDTQGEGSYSQNTGGTGLAALTGSPIVWIIIGVVAILWLHIVHF